MLDIFALDPQALAIPMSLGLNNDPADLPTGAANPLNQIFAWAKGIIVAIGIIGILFAAGKMAVGKFGRSDLAAEGVGSMVWVVLGISLMLVAVPVVQTIAGS